MTDQTNAELIAFTREEIEGLRRMGEHDWADALEGMMDALEAAERRAEEAERLAEVRRETIREYERENEAWSVRAHTAERELQVAEDQANNLAGDLAEAEKERDSAMASYKDYMTLHRKAAELSAVMEKARAVIECESGWFRYRAGRVLDILAASPADTLREAKAEAWQEGAYRVYNSTLDEAEWWWSDWASENPYRPREEQDREG